MSATVSASNTGFLNGISSAVTLPTHSAGDKILIFSGCSGEGATMTPDGVWDEEAQWSVPAEAYFTTGGEFYVWSKTAASGAETGPTVTKDVSRAGWYICAVITPFEDNYGKTTPVVYPEETQNPDPDAITFELDLFPLVLVLAGHADIMSPSPSPTGMSAVQFGASGANRSGTGGVIYKYTASSGTSYDPAVLNMRDNPNISGTHYAGCGIVTMAFYDQPTPDLGTTPLHVEYRAQVAIAPELPYMISADLI